MRSAGGGGGTKIPRLEILTCMLRRCSGAPGLPRISSVRARSSPMADAPGSDTAAADAQDLHLLRHRQIVGGELTVVALRSAIPPC